MDSERLSLIVECEGRRLDAALPSEVPLADLVLQLLELFGLPPDVTGWRVEGRAGEVLQGHLSLVQTGVQEGAEICLVQTAVPHRHVLPSLPELPPMPDLRPVPIAPSPMSQRVPLPEAPDLATRVRAVAQTVVSPEPDPAALGYGEAQSHDRLAIRHPRSARERAEAVWRAGDYRHQLDEAIRAPRLSRAVTIAIVSPKGGVGKTTTSALLGTLLAKLRSDRVVAIDSNPDYGTLGRILTPEHQIFVDDVLGVLHQPALTVTMLERLLGHAPHGLLVLPAPTEPGRMEGLDEADYERVIRRLQELAGILVLDCGAGLGAPITRTAMAIADQIVLVSDGDPITAGLVAEAGHRLPAGTPFTYVLNKQPRSGGRVNVDQLADEIPGARGLIQVEPDPGAAASLTEGRFDWEHAPAPWAVSFRELAAVLAADWAPLGLAA